MDYLFVLRNLHGKTCKIFWLLRISLVMNSS